ncbi:MAG: amino acid ABC transporter substrate-binding protein [Comamonadaceae bacterium]|jgi:ABC-type amino acid transport substrate-binding protein|nr:amino acid ABC transporter substrate-binding protein [Comamonadaceae bacterium]
MRLAALLLLACALPWQAQAAEPPLRFIAPLNHAMPFGGFEHDRFTTGIVKNISDAIAERLGRRAEFLLVPPRRVSLVLAAGEADGVCYVARDWIDGDFHWSPPVLEHVGVVAAHPRAPAIKAVAELAGRPLGTVHAYRYAQIEQQLGADFVRDDAPTMLINLRKLAARRMDYALTEQITLEYHNRLHPGDDLRSVLPAARFRTHCAFTRAHPLPLARLDQAVKDLVRDGSIERILARYR